MYSRALAQPTIELSAYEGPSGEQSTPQRAAPRPTRRPRDERRKSEHASADDPRGRLRTVISKEPRSAWELCQESLDEVSDTVGYLKQ